MIVVKAYILIGFCYLVCTMLNCLLWHREELADSWDGDFVTTIISDLLIGVAMIVGWPLLMYLDFVDKFYGDK